MNLEQINKKSEIFISMLTILCSVFLTIVLHAILPASANVQLFNSTLVMFFGFPAIAVCYFLVLYAQCAVTVRYVCNKTKISNMFTGVRFGLSFALIYLFGMQEVVIESSPFNSYGFEFVKYQFFMGIGDAIPVFLLCMAIALFTIANHSKKNTFQSIKRVERIGAVAAITITFMIERIVGYKTGIIQSNCNIYALPCYIWTLTFGVILGYVYIIVYPTLFSKEKWTSVPIRLLFTIGLNWIIFNSFMGLITKDAMSDSLLRSGSDVVSLFIATCIIGKFIIKPDDF